MPLSARPLDHTAKCDRKDSECHQNYSRVFWLNLKLHIISLHEEFTPSQPHVGHESSATIFFFFYYITNAPDVLVI